MKRAQTNWTPIYLLIVLIIAAVLIFTFKRTIVGAQNTATSNIGSARSIAQNALTLIQLLY
ncbi:hypothetical protein HUU53_02410 [Candidatus Micrarchaeota archaeon]|nr:hypothetical protein [Candidatus Micrarchaeota archaeon]